MKNKTLAALVVLLILLFAGLFWGNRLLKEKKAIKSPSELVSSSIQNQELPKTLEVGQKAPEFTAKTFEGDNISLSGLAGKTVVMTSAAAWCPTCFIEAKNFTPVYKEFKGKNVEFITVDIDKRDDRKLLAEFKRVYTPWHIIPPWEAEQIIKDYGFWRFEITYIIDKEGIVQFMDTGITDTETLRNKLSDILART